MWDDPAVAQRMRHLAEFVAAKPGTAETKAARDSIMNDRILPNDSRPPPYCKEDHYLTAVITPQKAKADGDNRMKGFKVLKAALEMSIHEGPGKGLIIDAITHEPLDTVYDITHTLPFSTSDPDRRVFEQATGQYLDTSHVDCRKNKLALSLGMHGIDTKHTLLRFPVFIDPDTRQPVISLRVASIIEWNLSHEPAERRNAYDELPPRTGKESTGTLFWAIEVNTFLQYRTLYDLNGMHPYQCPIKYGVFYRSHEDPFAVIGNTAYNMRVLELRQSGIKTDHLCSWAQEMIEDFRNDLMRKLTKETRAEDPDIFYAGLAATILREPVEIPERFVYTDPRASLSPGSTVDASSYALSPRGSDDSESDDDGDTRATPSPPETRRMTLRVRTTAAKVREELQKRQENEENARREEEKKRRAEEEDDVYESDDEVPVIQPDIDRNPPAPTISLPDVALDPSSSSYAADDESNAPTASSAFKAHAEDDIPDTSGIATPKQSSISLQDDNAPSTPPVADSSSESTTVVLNDPVTAGTEPPNNAMDSLPREVAREEALGEVGAGLEAAAEPLDLVERLLRAQRPQAIPLGEALGRVVVVVVVVISPLRDAAPARRPRLHLRRGVSERRRTMRPTRVMSRRRRSVALELSARR
ncbi:hypothetical protein CYLTODRAFT_492962 [Cylindrobasidium torrendii FP15055 ss-10]|uniref:Uncharacterized protein n=1 Tax=Cylindrobasidium torrendii FP15055 ss-10 TaxID=1314674 RepID=A0A0D7B383_9AGAR|nr:hypothetical protein CYLTODRAFT_492962 [Cylindrobasidium torrendii FP15055 ss-10]